MAEQTEQQRAERWRRDVTQMNLEQAVYVLTGAVQTLVEMQLRERDPGYRRKADALERELGIEENTTTTMLGHHYEQLDVVSTAFVSAHEEGKDGPPLSTKRSAERD